MIWTDPRDRTTFDLDPNYLNDIEQEHSPFHWALHKFAYNNQGKPILHIDMHGKAARTGAREN